MFTYWHNNPAAPFNPEFIEYAVDVEVIATCNCYKAGVYDNPDKVYRAEKRREEYERLMQLGKPSKNDVTEARRYIYEL
jgi:lysyl-tRNA synthetase class I